MPIRKSQGAAVGALVDLLKKAPPLSQEYSQSMIPSDIHSAKADSDSSSQAVQVFAPSVASSGILASKTTADALEELRAYREMKNLLLSQGGRPQTQTLASCASTVESVGKGTR